MNAYYRKLKSRKCREIKVKMAHNPTFSCFKMYKVKSECFPLPPSNYNAASLHMHPFRHDLFAL